MRFSPFAAVLCLGLVAVSCSKDPTGPVGPFAGHWIGADSYMTLDVTLQDNGGIVSGSGSMYGSIITGGTIAVKLSGDNDSTSCQLTVNAPPYTHLTITGVFTADTSFIAALNGSGFVDYTLTMVKQAH
jgi:hypothetical protein